MPAEQLKAYKEKHPNVYVVAYINCSAGVKALSDVICTSGNAQKIVDQVPADKEILFVPDQNLGQWVSQQTNRKMELCQLMLCACFIHFQRSQKNKRSISKSTHRSSSNVYKPFESLPMKSAPLKRWYTFVKKARRHFHHSHRTAMIHRLQREIPNKTFIAARQIHAPVMNVAS